jgi:osmotically-inducible protein OsmY
LGLERQVETRLWQDKRLDAASIVVDVEEGGKAVLTGLVPDAAHKDRAVMLARDTRGVEVVVDQLAVATATRTIETTPAPDVPTGVALGSRVIR